MITPTQMRAARAMLDVSQGHVAEYLGIAANTLSKIESGQSDVSMSRMSDIQRFYEREGIEFTNNDGVQRRTGGVVTYSGRNDFLDFMDDVYNTVKDGGEILVNNVAEVEFLRWMGEDVTSHMVRMSNIKNLSFKILVKEGDENTVASNYAKYRSLLASEFGTVPLYLYGDKMALIIFEENDVDVFVIRHSAVSKYFCNRFLEQWDKAGE